MSSRRRGTGTISSIRSECSGALGYLTLKCVISLILFFCCRSFTGISTAQSKALVEDAHVYLTANGRISMAGLNSKNLRYFAEALDRVVRTV
jgi:aspartate/tyrosine/aromatic aminotransferase